MRIDPHVHCRDGRQSYKETIEHVFRLCDSQGIDVIFDMPNTDPPVLKTEDVEKRLSIVPKNDFLRYRLFVGSTPDARQLQEAVRMVKECRQVVGLKLYAGPTEGNLGVCAEKDQKMIYDVLAGLGYEGVLAVHCEKKNLCRQDFDHQKPVSHCAARPPEAEISAVDDQIKFARTSGFRGVLHICHVSAAASLALIKSVKAEIRITCGVTPHHLLWACTQMNNRDGLLYKVNPPLRELNNCIAMRQALKNGDIDWIETDHAPHPVSEKLYPPYASGYPSICLYGELVDKLLPLWGFDGSRINDVTCNNIRKTFTERKV
jgi:dihydroorotase